MRSNRNVALWAVAAALLTQAACGSRPIPYVAVEGTTFTIAVPESYGPAFGRTISSAMDPTSLVTVLPTPAYDPASPLEDLLRGELVFTLLDYQGSFLSYLPVNYITRVHAEEASGSNEGGGQTIAFVDIPDGVVAANGGQTEFFWTVERLRRDLDDLDGDNDRQEFVDATPLHDGVPWTGWSGLSPGGGGRIFIREAGHPAGTHFQSHTAWDVQPTYGPIDVGADLESLVPKPSIGVVLYQADAPFAEAWEVEVDYPEDKVEIVGVEVGGAQKSGALAMLSHVTSQQDGCPTGNGRVRISYVDPTPTTQTLRLVLKPREFDCGSGRAVQADFLPDPTTLVAYDATGASLTGFQALVNSKVR